MRTRSYYEVSCLGSTVLAGCVVAINIATFASIGVVGKPTANEIAVNRVNKGDRLASVKTARAASPADAGLSEAITVWMRASL